MNPKKWLIFAVALGLIATTAGLLYQLKNRPRLTAPGVKVGPVRIYNEDGQLAAGTSVLVPDNYPGCSVTHCPIAKIELSSLPKDTTYGRMGYTFPDGFAVLATTVLMGSDRTSIHQPQFCLQGQGWSITNQENITLHVTKPFPYTFPALKLTAVNVDRSADGKPMPITGIYIYWFVSHDQITAGQGTRLWSMVGTLMHQGLIERWAYISYFAACRPGQEQATFHRLQDFISGTLPQFQLTTGTPAQ